MDVSGYLRSDEAIATYDAGVADERARIVAWLRDERMTVDFGRQMPSYMATLYADRIEAGEHHAGYHRRYNDMTNNNDSSMPAWQVNRADAEYTTGTCVELPCCGLLMGAEHYNADDTYTCPQCEPFPSNGVQAIAVERHRQVTAEGYSPEHDDEHTEEEIAQAAAQYALPTWLRDMRHGIYDGVPGDWPWEPQAWKPSPDRVSELVKAGALIAAEIDRLTRAK